MLKIIIVITGMLLLSGCADGFKGYFNRSANNKWIDTKGFHGGKRKPLYNKKYINMAKRNLIEENFDDEDEELDLDETYEGPNISRMNREMYIEMIKQDEKRKKRQRLEQYKKAPYRGGRQVRREEYPSLNEANERVNNSKDNDADVQRELAEIKAMLNDAKKDLTKYKCPMEVQPSRPKVSEAAVPSQKKL